MPRFTSSARAQMAVAGVDVAPRVDDADDRLAAPVGGVVAELAQPRAVAEGAKVVRAEPAMAAQVFRTSAGHGRAFTLNAPVIARSRDAAIQSLRRCKRADAASLDCFAPLAMTDKPCRHCEERSDEAIQSLRRCKCADAASLDCFASLAMTDVRSQ